MATRKIAESEIEVNATRSVSHAEQRASQRFLQIPASVAYCAWSINAIWYDLGIDRMGNPVKPGPGSGPAKVIVCVATAVIAVVWLFQLIRDRGAELSAR